MSRCSLTLLVRNFRIHVYDKLKDGKIHTTMSADGRSVVVGKVPSVPYLVEVCPYNPKTVSGSM